MNTVKLVGKIKEVPRVLENTSKDGKYTFINGTIVLTVEKGTHFVGFRTFKYNQDGALTKNAEILTNSEKYIGKQVNITGELKENLYCKEPELKQKGLVSNNAIELTWINLNEKEVEELIEFTIDGVVVKELKPVIGRDGETTLYYEMSILHQEKGDKFERIHKIVLNVPSDFPNVDKMESHYTVGNKVTLSGAVVNQQLANIKNSDDNTEDLFGEVKSSTVRFQRLYSITGGTKPTELDAEEVENIKNKYGERVETAINRAIQKAKATEQKEETPSFTKNSLFD